MALSLTEKYQITVDGTTIVVTDTTGAYDADTNPGGWGDPNPELNESAIVALVRRVVDDVETSFTPVGNYAVYDPAAVNTKQTQFNFTILNDGHIKMYVFRLPVSTDGINSVSGEDINEGDFFYWNNGSLIWKILGGSAVAATVEDLIGVDTVVQTLCEDLIFPKLSLKYNELYNHYRQIRDESCNDAERLFQKLLRLRLDLAGAKYMFRSGLIESSEDKIQTLLKKYDLL